MKTKIEQPEWARNININHEKKCIEGVMQRDYVIDRAEANEDGSVSIAFSSEQPVERWFGTEVLEHSKDAVNMTRLNTGGAVLVGHDTRDQVGGIVDDTARVDSDKVARADIIFSDSVRGQDIERDVKRKIRRLVSVGYRVDKFEVEEREGKTALYTAKKWTPVEVSIVPIPADATVGVDRALEEVKPPENKREIEIKIIKTEERETEIMKTDEEIAKEKATAAAELKTKQNEARKEERDRIAGIQVVMDNPMFKGNGKVRELCQKAIKEGGDAGLIGLEALELVGQAGKITPEAAERDANVGLSEDEIKKYSVHRAIRNQLESVDDNLEGEVQRALVKKLGESGRAGGFYLPREAQTRATQVTTTGSLGGFLVQDTSLSIIELLRNKMMVKQLGATVLTGMKGNVTIPKVAGASTAFWVAENVAPTQSNVTLGQLALNPKTIAGNIAISRNLVMQSDPSAEQLFSNDLARTLAIALDLAAINGSGTNGEPTGIINTENIGSTSTATVSWLKMLGFDEDVAVANADMGTLAFLTTPSIRTTLKTTEKASSTAQFIWVDNTIDGKRAEVSNQVPSANIIYGDFAQLIIAEFGTLEIQVITQGTNHRAGEIELDAFQSVDLGVRQPGAFSVSTDFS